MTKLICNKMLYHMIYICYLIDKFLKTYTVHKMYNNNETRNNTKLPYETSQYNIKLFFRVLWFRLIAKQFLQEKIFAKKTRYIPTYYSRNYSKSNSRFLYFYLLDFKNFSLYINVSIFYILVSYLIISCHRSIYYLI